MSDLMGRLRTAQGYYDQSIPPDVIDGGGGGATPTVTSINPNSIVINTPTTITVTGTNFNASTQVVVDGVAQQTQFVSATSLTYSAEASSAGTQSITVRTGGGLASNAVTLTVTAS